MNELKRYNVKVGFKYTQPVVIGVLLRWYLAYAFGTKWCENRPELSTPITSKRNLLECGSFVKSGISPYSSDQCHEVSYIIYFYNTLYDFGFLFPFWILLDVVSASCAGYVGSKWSDWYVLQMKHKESPCRHRNSHFFIWIWMLNPIGIVACLSLNTQVLYNTLILVFLARYKTQEIVAGLALAITSVSQIYPVQLIIPFIVYGKRHTFQLTMIVTICALISICMYLDMEYLRSVYMYILGCPDYSPTISIFWYLITLMFEHFRTFFIAILQVNVFIYAIPLSLRFTSKQMPLVLYVLISIQAIFKSYATLTDLLVPLVLYPAFDGSSKFRKTSFIGLIALCVCVTLSPVMWSQWVILGRGNSNFFFGTSLGIVVSMTLLITDVLLGHVKLDYAVMTGKFNEILELGHPLPRKNKAE